MRDTPIVNVVEEYQTEQHNLEHCQKCIKGLEEAIKPIAVQTYEIHKGGMGDRVARLYYQVEKRLLEGLEILRRRETEIKRNIEKLEGIKAEVPK